MSTCKALRYLRRERACSTWRRMRVRRRRKVWKTERFVSDLEEKGILHPHVKPQQGDLQTLLSTLQPLPGLVHHETVPRAGEVLRVPSRPAVDVFPHWLADSQEVRPQTADGVFGYVRQRLADGGAEDEAAHRLVDACQVLGPRRLVRDARHVDGQAFATDDLRPRRYNH